jgi:hypothetical protein
MHTMMLINTQNIACHNYNPILRAKYKSSYNKKIQYYITLTNNPVHKDHFVIVNQNKELRAHHFYYPDDKFDILKDMIDINLKTGNYVYNSIEVGSIPEVIHFHTSSEKPPLDTICKMVGLQHILYANNGISFYKVDNEKFVCGRFYYVTVNYDKIDIITKILPSTLLHSRISDDIKYAAQIFICPDNGKFIRIVITFRKVEVKYYRLENGKFPQNYYDALFTTMEMQYNLLGYESQNIDESKINDTNYIEHIIESKKKIMPYYCDNAFTYNKLFETKLLENLVSVNNFGSLILSSYNIPNVNNISFLFRKLLIIVENVANDKKLFISEDTNNDISNVIEQLSIVAKINKQYDINKNYYNGFCNGKLCTIISYNENESNQNIIISESALIFNNLLLYNILISTLICHCEKRLNVEILQLVNNDKEYSITTSLVKTNLKIFIQFEKLNSAIVVWINAFLMQILYSLYVLYKHYKLLYCDISVEDIIISDDLYYNKHIEQYYVFSKMHTFVVDWGKNGNNCCTYGYTAYLSNFHKCSIKLSKKKPILSSHWIKSYNVVKFNDNIISLINSLNSTLQENGIYNNYVTELNNYVSNYKGKDNIIDILLNDNLPYFETYRDHNEKHPRLNVINNLLQKTPIFLANNLQTFRTFMISNKTVILSKLQDMYKNNIITVPKNTYFITGVANRYMKC